MQAATRYKTQDARYKIRDTRIVLVHQRNLDGNLAWANFLLLHSSKRDFSGYMLTFWLRMKIKFVTRRIRRRRALKWRLQFAKGYATCIM